MEHLSPSRRTGFAPIDFILTRVFKLDPEGVRDALRRAWRTRFGLRDDDDMPKVAPAASLDPFSNARTTPTLARRSSEPSLISPSSFAMKEDPSDDGGAGPVH